MRLSYFIFFTVYDKIFLKIDNVLYKGEKMKENRIKRFFETKISLTGVVFFILAIITIINIL